MVAPVPAQISSLRLRPPAAPLRRPSRPLLATHYPLSTLFLSALCFHILTNCFPRNPFILITIRIARGCTPTTLPSSVFCFQPPASTHEFSRTSGLFALLVLFSAVPPFVFNHLQPLFPKPGVGVPFGVQTCRCALSTRVYLRDGQTDLQT